MTTFAFTTGNPNNLTGGSDASMTDIQGPLTDLRTFVNSGNLDETNVPNLSAAFTVYKDLRRATAELTSAVGAGLYGLSMASGALNLGAVGSQILNVVTYLTPADYNANARTTKLRIRLTSVSNSIGSAVTYTAGLYPLTGIGGTGPNGPVVNALGTVVTGSTVAIVNPPAFTPQVQTGSDFNFPAAGNYVLAVQTTGAQAANGVTDLIAQLQMRQV